MKRIERTMQALEVRIGRLRSGDDELAASEIPPPPPAAPENPPASRASEG
jgi:hypothetical protein